MCRYLTTKKRKKLYFLNLAPRQYYFLQIFHPRKEGKSRKIDRKCRWKRVQMSLAFDFRTIKVFPSSWPKEQARRAIAQLIQLSVLLITWTIHENLPKEENGGDENRCSNQIGRTKWRRSVDLRQINELFMLNGIRRTSSWRIFLFRVVREKLEIREFQAGRNGRLVIEASINENN